MTDMLPNMLGLGARFAAWPQSRRAARKRSDACTTVPQLRPQVEIPARDPDPEMLEHLGHLDRGRHLARQDNWDVLSREIRLAEQERRKTCGLTSVASLLSQGARSDAVEAVHMAIGRGDARGARGAMAALATIREDYPDDPVMAHVVAMAQVDLANAWAAGRSAEDLPEAHRDGYDGAMQVASALADQFDPFELDSPLWAEARCAVLPADPRPAARAADDYEDLIELDPGCPHHMIALGGALLPGSFGTMTTLDTQARRVASLTSDFWGAGGYVFTMMGAMERDTVALRRTDPELFAEGLHDIMTRRCGPTVVNRLAAFCGVTAQAPDMTGPARDRIADCFTWIAADHLTELHPRLWAEAPIPGAEPLYGDAPERRGKARAHAALAQHFAAQVDAGQKLVFTAAGMQVCPVN